MEELFYYLMMLCIAIVATCMLFAMAYGIASALGMLVLG